MSATRKGRFQRGDSVAPKPPERQWHYLDCPDQKGPYAESVFIELLRHGVVRPEHKVWTDGMDDWGPLGSSPLKAFVPDGASSPGPAKRQGAFARFWRRLFDRVLPNA